MIPLGGYYEGSHKGYYCYYKASYKGSFKGILTFVVWVPKLTVELRTDRYRLSLAAFQVLWNANDLKVPDCSKMWWHVNLFWFHTGCDVFSGYYQAEWLYHSP